MINPIFDLDFASGEALDPRVAFARGTTGTYFDRNGRLRTAPINQPRVDHDPLTGRPLGLLVEEARTNLLKYSETFAVPWLTSVGAFTGARNTAPNGNNAMVWFDEYTATAWRLFYQDVTLTAGATYTASIFAKIGTRFRFTLSIQTASGTAQASFNLKALTTITAAAGGGSVAGASIQHVGGGIYRCSFTGIAHPTETAGKVQFNLLGDDGSLIYSGSEFNGIWLWGAQLEAGSYPTSYIATTSATATRAADFAAVMANVVAGLNALEGTLLLETSRNYIPAGTSDLLLFSNSTGTEFHRISADSAGTPRASTRVGGADTVSITGPFSLSGGLVNIGYAWKAGDCAAAINGGMMGTSSSTSMPTGMDRVWIGSLNGGNVYRHHVRRARVYPRRLTNAALRRMTVKTSALRLVFSADKALDPRVQFSRDSVATYWDAGGTLRTAQAGVPRFDHQPATGASLGLLVEESRANLLWPSSDFTHANWSKSAVTITADTTLAPDGTTTADTFMDSSTTDYGGAAAVAGVANDTTARTASIFAKAGTMGFLQLYVSYSGGTPVNAFVRVNLSTGTVDSTGGNPDQYGVQDVGGGWYRVWVTKANNGSGNTSCVVNIYGDAGAVENTGTILIWGAQLEAGAFPTSYIPTTTAAVTRQADVVTLPLFLVPEFNPAEGTLVAGVTFPVVDTAAVNTLVHLDDGTANNRVTLRRDSGGLGFLVTTSGSNVAGLPAGTQPPAGVTRRIAAAWKADDFAASTSGGGVLPDTSGAIPAGLTTLRIGNTTGVQFCNAPIAVIELHPSRLPDVKLRGLSA